MTKPVLVVHGVANRDRAAFEAQVAKLARKIDARWNLIPVFWGDLGGQDAGVDDTLPLERVEVRSQALGIDPAVVEAVLSGTSEQIVTRAAGTPEAAIIDGADQVGINAAGVQTRAAGATDALREAVREQLPKTRYLSRIGNRAVLEAVGRTLGTAAGEAGGSTGSGAPGAPSPYDESPALAETRGVKDRIRNVSKEVLQSLDELVGIVVGESLGGANQLLREYAVRPFIKFFGDILAYQRNQEAIHQRLWDAISQFAPGYGTKAKPIDVIAHSLGGLVSFDAAVIREPPLHIKSLVTFGSQPAFFHVLDPRSPLPAYVHGHPVTLPDTIGSWTNLWEPLDFLAFVTSRVFRLASGSPPRDMEVNHLASYGLYTHSVYWETAELIKAIETTLNQRTS